MRSTNALSYLQLVASYTPHHRSPTLPNCPPALPSPSDHLRPDLDSDARRRVCLLYWRGSRCQAGLLAWCAVISVPCVLNVQSAGSYLVSDGFLFEVSDMLSTVVEATHLGT